MRLRPNRHFGALVGLVPSLLEALPGASVGWLAEKSGQPESAVRTACRALRSSGLVEELPEGGWKLTAAGRGVLADGRNTMSRDERRALDRSLRTVGGP